MRWASLRSAHPTKAAEAPLFPTLTDEQRQFVHTIRELAQSEFRERAPRWMDGTFPWENMKRLAELGVLGMAGAGEYGGVGPPWVRPPPGPQEDAQRPLPKHH